jgi:hypothetical protein
VKHKIEFGDYYALIWLLNLLQKNDLNAKLSSKNDLD